MNGPIWGMIREFVIAEVRLGAAELRYKDWPDSLSAQYLEPLREQVTRSETAAREAIEKYDSWHSNAHMKLERIDYPPQLYGGGLLP